METNETNIKINQTIEDERPVEDQTLINSERPVESETPVDSELPTEPEQPIDSELPNEDEMPIEDQPPTEDEPLLEVEVPVEDATLIDCDPPVVDEAITENETSTVIEIPTEDDGAPIDSELPTEDDTQVETESPNAIETPTEDDAPVEGEEEDIIGYDLGKKSEKKIKAKKNALKITLKVLKIILIIAFLPIVIIYLVTKNIIDKKQKRKWENSGKRGKELILTTAGEDLSKISHYEFKELIKSLFFYDGYKVDVLSKDEKQLFFEKDGKTTFCYLCIKNKPAYLFNKTKRMLKEAKEDYDNVLVISLGGFIDEINAFLATNNISKMDRNDILDMIDKVKESLKRNQNENLDEFKNVKISQRFPYMI